MRYILHRWPRLLSDKYQLAPIRLLKPDLLGDPGPYAGESVLHMCIVKEARGRRPPPLRALALSARTGAPRRSASCCCSRRRRATCAMG